MSRGLYMFKSLSIFKNMFSSLSKIFLYYWIFITIPHINQIIILQFFKLEFWKYFKFISLWRNQMFLQIFHFHWLYEYPLNKNEKSLIISPFVNYYFKYKNSKNTVISVNCMSLFKSKTSHILHFIILTILQANKNQNIKS